ncbi:hypothetical protein L873DRAFT_1788402 [Choiromyces venosus 120613-1]|uniref:Paired domain-containing protein n=1 Tax=Choiromyces venosus 120613-1 TaxID=1336337 RepID=A0A3N4JSN7_9PEZI|nr:hypothetical protein L873DRAFT_1788402 [Choiromyces venosus 120613-1]
MPRNRATGKHCMATINERVAIELHAQGKSYWQIANETGISKDAVQKIIKYWSNTGELNSPPCPGKQQSLSERGIQHLVCLSDLHPCATLAEIAQMAGFDVKLCTLGKYLCQANCFVFVAHCKPWLERESQKQRRQWCRERRMWRKEDFQKLVYTDEVQLQVSAGTG